MASDNDSQQAWFLKSSCPVELPVLDALSASRDEFESFVAKKLAGRNDTAAATPALQVGTADEDAFTLVSDSTSAEIRKQTGNLRLEDDTFSLVSTPTVAERKQQASKKRRQTVDETEAEEQGHSTGNIVPGQPFMQALLSHQDKKHKPDTEDEPDMENKMFTENVGIAYRSTTNALLDLFSELDEVVSGPRLRELLEAAWQEDPLTTLKLIFNSRSIHLGQSSRNVFYRCAGWLAQNHPHTLVTNLRWLCRPVIEKKVKKQDADGDLVLVESEEGANDEDTKYDVKYGVAHGYWKDILNMLTLAVNDKFGPLANPKDVLNSENAWARSKKLGSGGRGNRSRTIASGRSRGRASGRGRGSTRGRGRGRGGGRGGSLGHVVVEAAENLEEEQKMPSDPAKAKEARHEIRGRRHKIAVEALENDPVYLCLHLAVARLFAEQLQADLKALRGTDAKAKRAISLCGKWAPSHDHFHDRHTFVVSSIAELLHPRESLDHVLSPSDDRETYLRHAREAYRKDVSALRRHLEVVERDVTAGTFDRIKYDRVPSVAMKNYVPLFVEKDFERFEKYIDRVAEGKARISGATLLPAKMVLAAKQLGSNAFKATDEELKRLTPQQIIDRKVDWIKAQALDGQWNTLVQRIKDSGTLSASIAVCDVSGSMMSPQFPDGTCPMDSAIGLSLLIAEVTEPPFGGAFITFTSTPAVAKVDLSQPLAAKISSLRNSQWGMTTDFIAVFEKLLLPMAIENKIKPEDMVKRIFVFSDMQFDEAQKGYGWGSETTVPAWDETAYENIKRQYAASGYEMPELIFWNLAGGRAGYGGGDPYGDPTAPKPVTAAEPGTSLVSGYSQAMLKVFLENGSAGGEAEAEDEGEDEGAKVDTNEDEDGETVVVKKRKAGQTDPVATMKKATGHKAYDMLRVMD
ncbi:hypothetical protein HJFPF1_06146 [Paramyrothecium foliicola]|nr:hypothetical protein HJFPF1_06146 [Paramyrothecium foliicola]